MPTLDIAKFAGAPPKPTDTTNTMGIGFDTVAGLVKLTDGTTSKTLVDTDTAQILTGPKTLSGAIESDIKVLAASATYDNSAALTTLTGFSWSVVAAGTYVFDVELETTMTTVGGLAVAFKLTTATLTSIRYVTYASTATDNATAVSTTGTTTTDATKMFDSKTAAYTRVRVHGSFVVNAAGTFAIQTAQNTAAAGGDATIVLIGSQAKVIRVA